MPRYAHWFLRLPFAAALFFHGAPKLLNPGMAEQMQLPLPVFLLVGIGEVLAAVGAIVGGIPGAPRRKLVNRLTGLAAAPIMIGAIVLVHGPQWSFIPSAEKPIGGMEFQVTLLGIALYFLISGGREASAE